MVYNKNTYPNIETVKYRHFQSDFNLRSKTITFDCNDVCRVLTRPGILCRLRARNSPFSSTEVFADFSSVDFADFSTDKFAGVSIVAVRLSTRFARLEVST